MMRGSPFRLNALRGTNEKAPGGCNHPRACVSTKRQLGTEQLTELATPFSHSLDCRASGAVFMPTIREITTAVAARYGVPSADLAAHRSARARDARPRLLVCWLARQCTPYTLARIGRHFGGRDHKTVAHAVKRVERLMQTDRQLAEAATSLREALA